MRQTTHKTDEHISVENEHIINLFNRLNLRHPQDPDQLLTTADILHITEHSLQCQEPQDDTELIKSFLQKLIKMNYMARYTHIQHMERNEYISCTTEAKGDKHKDKSDINFNIHPMDVQMAVFHFADSFLKQLVMNKLSECQYALPLLVPNPFTQQIDFPLWTFRQINKSWKMTNSNKEIITKTQPVCKAKTPMVAFFRFDSVSSSKSQLMSNLISDKHDIFFHRNCKGSSRTRLLMDGVVEIAWYCPSGKKTDKFTDCVAFCNLHGDAGAYENQLKILTKLASVNVVILPQLNRNDKNATKIQQIYKDSTPVVCLLAESNSPFTVIRKGKYKIGLKDRSQTEITEELRRAINDGLSHLPTDSCPAFRLEDIAGLSDIRVDEANDNNCRRGKEAAQKMMTLLQEKDLVEIKDSFLPCQGKLWHQWCQKNKELHQPEGDQIEIDISRKQTDLEKIRKDQQASGISEFIKLFLEEMITLPVDKKIYFLKWLGILLNEQTSKELSALHLKYHIKCSKVLTLKDKRDKSEELTAEQTKLKAISKNLQAANFGLEHILREVGQIYESCSSVEKNKEGLQCHFSSLPSLAAEMMISGFPLELMDGDAAHVPVIWVTAVLDELIKKLGDLNIFVLSVLGIQSSGKSTMLNAMFGLQFAVSAGRCTRGAFMQLVKVSEDMKPHLKFDYILVVDTEGLCSPELSAKETRHHDNELATFVAGLGNLTLINIFGECSAEIHNILQIVVQAFLRMKQVKLNPSCIFVHQNISDATAEEKTMEGKMTLQEELDKMTIFAAKNEVCDVRCFKDVIKFNVQNDVKYFAQLWEGTPPMAPPNPDYSESAQDLKKTIILHASQSDGMMLTHLKEHIQDLWKALLNERFVFSFKNSLEVVNYRKLETEYSKWSWNLHSSMLEIENKLLNKIENGVIHDIVDKDFQEMSEEVKKSMAEFFQKNKNASMLNHWKTFEIKIKELQESIMRETKRNLNEVLQQQDLKKKNNAQRKHHENILFEKSKKLALTLKVKEKVEKTLKEQFDCLWEQWLDDIRKDTPAIKKTDILSDISQILTEKYESVPVDWYESSECNDFTTLPDYSGYVIFKHPQKGDKKESRRGDGRENKAYVQMLSQEDKIQIKALVKDIVEVTDKMMKSSNIAQVGYNYIHHLTELIKRKVKEHEEGPVTYVFKRGFTMDLTLHVCKTANKIFTDLHRKFRESNDPVFYFKRMRGEYYNIFCKYCQGETLSAIFGELICNKLKEPIQESLYKKTARELANEMKTNCESFNGNRSKLEKYILKLLAEKENFDMYMEYINNPREHIKTFIRDEVNKYIGEKFSVSILPKIKKHIEILQKKIIDTAHEAFKLVKKKGGEVDLWLNTFTQQLSDMLIFSKNTLSEVGHDDVDINLLEDAIIKTLPTVMEDINNEFNTGIFMDKYKPDEILIKHFCDCCWVQCPFCKAICTNTIENHSGDHTVPFHRNIGLNGWHYRGTTNLSVSICTSEVARNNYFFPNDSYDKEILWTQYRKAGPSYANWSITPDLSELPYWKWFVCRFQKDLETYYSKTFQGKGKIPDEWKKYKKQNAIESLTKYY